MISAARFIGLVSICVITYSALSPVPARAKARTVGLILSASGAITPKPTVFSSIQEGSRYILDPEARLTFVHFATCSTRQLQGGDVIFTALDAEAMGARLIFEKSGICPKLTGDVSTRRLAGVKLRASGAGAIDLPSTPSFAFQDALAARQFDRVKVFDGNALLYQAPLEGSVFFWPAEWARLSPGKSYRLYLKSVKNEKESFELPFYVDNFLPLDAILLISLP